MEWMLQRLLYHGLVLYLSLCVCQTFAASHSSDSQKIAKFSKLLDELRLLKKGSGIYGPNNMPVFSHSQDDSSTLNDRFDFLKNANNDKEGQVDDFFMADSDALLHDLDANGLSQEDIERSLNAWRTEPGDNSKSKRNWNIEMKSAEKRQGWDFDYGLGGGRFGKRGLHYRDYPLGGGRFGRDLDHIDIDFDN